MEQINLAEQVAGQLPIANGGTGSTSFAAAGIAPLINAGLVNPSLGTPASGTLTNCTGLPATTGITGILPAANGGTGVGIAPATITAGAATSGTGQTQLASLSIPANTLVAGSTFEIKAFGVTSSTGSITCEIHIGTTNTTSDAIAVTVPATGTTAAGIMIDAILTVRTTGSSGTCIANGFTASINTLQGSTATSTTAVNTTVGNFITLSAAIASGTFTGQVAYIKPVK